MMTCSEKEIVETQLRPTFFGGVRVWVKVACTCTDPHDCSESPVFYKWRKATADDLSKLKISL